MNQIFSQILPCIIFWWTNYKIFFTIFVLYNICSLSDFLSNNDWYMQHVLIKSSDWMKSSLYTLVIWYRVFAFAVAIAIINLACWAKHVHCAGSSQDRISFSFAEKQIWFYATSDHMHFQQYGYHTSTCRTISG